MNKLRVLALFILSASLSFSSLAQKDTMIYINGEKVIGYLERGNDKEVTFSLDVNDRKVIINEKESSIYKINLTNGQSITYTQIKNRRNQTKFQKDNSARRARQQLLEDDSKIKLLKLNFSALAFQAFSMGVEKMIKPGHHWDLTLGFPSVMSGNRFFGGINVQAGYKRFLIFPVEENSDFLSRPFHGAYLKPEIVLAFNSLLREGINSAKDFDTGQERMVGMLLNTGYQIERPSGFIIDFFAGIGIGDRVAQGRAFEDKKSRTIYRTPHYGTFSFFGGNETDNYSLVFYTAGVNIGFKF